MMPLWFLALILSAGPPAPTNAPALEAVDVYRCDFSEAFDKNFDGWPDGWTRRRGAGYPLFLKVEIANDAPAGEPPRPALRMQLDGGAASVFSPHIPVSPLFSYRVEGLLKTAGLKHDIASYSVLFFDADGRLLETHESHHYHDQPEWTPVSIGPILASHPDTYTAVIGLHLRPRASGAADLRGTVWFDDVKLARLPRVVLRCDRKLHLYDKLDEVEVLCEVSGVRTANPIVTFTLENVEGGVVATHQMPLAALPATTGHTLAPAKKSEPTPAEHGHEHDDEHDEKHDKKPHDLAHSDEPIHVRGFAGTASWRPPLKDYGFYRVRAALADSEETRIERSTTFAVARPLNRLARGEFGWTLPEGDAQLSLQELVGLVGQVGIHWLKFPMWYGEEDTARPDRLAWFADRAGQQNVNVVGLLDHPPASVRKLFGDAAELPVATLFVEAPLWQPAVDPVMTRLSLKVRWWQLGSDADTSFVGFPQLDAKIAEIKQHFLKYGQEVQVGLSWPWLNEPAAGPWDYLSHTAAPELTARETSDYLAAPTRAAHARWMILEPLSEHAYDLPTRARDLVERMIAAKIHGADAVFLPDPFAAQQGLLHRDGTPRELLLPWRTTATLLGGAEYLGTIHLPGGSTNHLFRRGHEAFMVVWNRTPTKETLFLGDTVDQFDLWGRTVPVEHTTVDGSPAHAISAGPLPTFVTGLNLAVAQWRIKLAFESPNLPSVFGRDQLARYQFENTFGQGVGGEVRVTSPEDWEIAPLTTTFRGSEGETIKESLQVRLKSEARSGPQMLRLDFKVTGDRDYAFSVYQPLHVGIGDVSIDVITRMDDEGRLVLEQTFLNQTDKFVSFNCLLFAPGRRRERVQVLELGRGRHSATYVLSDGEKLLGQTLLLRAEEISGDRVLNYRIVPEP